MAKCSLAVGIINTTLTRFLEKYSDIMIETNTLFPAPWTSKLKTITMTVTVHLCWALHCFGPSQDFMRDQLHTNPKLKVHFNPMPKQCKHQQAGKQEIIEDDMADLQNTF